MKTKYELGQVIAYCPFGIDSPSFLVNVGEITQIVISKTGTSYRIRTNNDNVVDNIKEKDIVTDKQKLLEKAREYLNKEVQKYATYCERQIKDIEETLGELK